MIDLSPKSGGGGGKHEQQKHHAPQHHAPTKPTTQLAPTPAPAQVTPPAVEVTTPAGTQVPISFAQFDTLDTMISKLTQIKEQWIKKYAGKTNYNPYLEVARFIDPLIKEFKFGQIPMEIAFTKVGLVPKDCPVIDPNFVPAAPEGAPRLDISAKEYGAKNVE
jgi:hypothetical protein